MVLEHTCRLGLEGIVSKRSDAPYRKGRSDYWRKAKCVLRQEFVVVGYVPSTTSQRSVGSLALGYYAKGKLIYAGRVGTGYSATEAKSLRNVLESIKVGKPPIDGKLPQGAEKGVYWTKPDLVCEVEYRGWTEAALIRQGSYKGLREDKLPQEVVLEGDSSRASNGNKPNTTYVLTHPDRVAFRRCRAHQARASRLLHRDRQLDFAAYCQAPLEPPPLPFRRRREVLFRQASLAGHER